MMPSISVHREIFFMYNPPGPWLCFFCNQSVEYDPSRLVRYHTKGDSTAFVVHHVNGDHWDNHPENLRAAHTGCHTRHHNLSGKKWKGGRPRVEIDKQALVGLYLEEGFSIPEIARQLGLSLQTVRRRMQDYGIPARTIREARVLQETQKRASYGV